MKHFLVISFFLTFLFLIREHQILEFSAFNVDIKEMTSHIAWVKSNEKDHWYPLTEAKSSQRFEDGMIDFRPDYHQKYEDILSNLSSYCYQIEFPDGSFYSTDPDPDVCIYLNTFDRDAQFLSPFRKQIHTTMEGTIDVTSEFHRTFDSEYYKGLLFDNMMEITGIYSQEFLDYKLKEIWIRHLNEVLDHHVDIYRPSKRKWRKYRTHTAIVNY